MAVVCLALHAGVCRGADLAEIVEQATAKIQSDWAADPDYAYVERDETVKSGKTTSKTSQVVLIDGSDYYMPLAVNDRPLSREQQKSELRKLKAEYQRRKSEDPDTRRRRVAGYKRREAENGSLLLAFPKAFNFALLGEQTMNGHPAYALSATPKARTGPLSRTDKVLAAMKGTVWVDSMTFHAIRGDCTAIAPAPIYGILARVLPGTHIDLELEPVSDSVWLISKFSMSLNLSKLLFFNSTEIMNNTYTDYKMNSEAVAELLAKADEP